MSGWWSIDSASVPTLLMNARASGKSRNVQVRAIVFPSRDHPGVSRRRVAMSCSERRERRAIAAGKAIGGKRMVLAGPWDRSPSGAGILKDLSNRTDEAFLQAYRTI